MVIFPHMVIGSVSASLLVDGVGPALVIGLISHYLLDSIPHSEYRLRFMEGLGVSRAGLLQDGLKLSIDGALGLGLVFLIWNQGVFAGPVLAAGALGGVMPDALEVVGKLLPNRILKACSAVHYFFHCAPLDRCWKLPSASVPRALVIQGLMTALALLFTGLMTGII